MATHNHFYELPVYQKCRLFRKRVAVIVRSHFPRDEKYLLTAQILDAARSITANIAEGFGRYHYQENIQFCRQGRGSLSETMEHLITAYDDGYLSEYLLKETNTDYKNCLKELNKYIKYLKQARESSNNQ